MAVKKGTNPYAEVDKMNRAGDAALYRAKEISAGIKEAMSEEGMKEKVMEFIFSGDPEAESPLAEIRAELETKFANK